MGEFRALLIEGIFYEDDARRLLCDTGRGVKDVRVDLRALLGQRVRIAAHHLPRDPDPLRWGGGACLWQPSGRCPAGHHDRPTWLYNFVAEGVLDETEDVFRVEGFDGGVVEVALATMLPGHHARVAAATVLSAEAMREALDASGMESSVEGLGARIENLQEILGRLRTRSEEPG
jgi:hypothetical protein